MNEEGTGAIEPDLSPAAAGVGVGGETPDSDEQMVIGGTGPAAREGGDTTRGAAEAGDPALERSRGD